MTDIDLAALYRKRSSAILASYDQMLKGESVRVLSDALRDTMLDELPTVAGLFDELLGEPQPPAEQLSRVFSRMTPLLSLASVYADQARWAQAIIEALAAANLEIDAGLINAVAYSLDATGDAERAALQYEILLGLFKDQPDHAALSPIWFNISLHHYRAERLVEAMEACEKSLAIAEKHNDERSMVVALLQQCTLFRILDELGLARGCIQRAGELIDKLESSELQLRYFETAAMLIAEYRPQQAPAFFAAGIAFAGELHDADTQARMLFSQAAYYDGLGQRDDALRAAAKSLEIYEQLGSHHAAEVRKVIGMWLVPSDSSSQTQGGQTVDIPRSKSE